MWVYILYSESTAKFYTGQTSNLEDRITRHNSMRSISTKKGAPWKLVWSKKVRDRSEAVLLEQKIKKRGAKRFIEMPIQTTKAFCLQ